MDKTKRLRLAEHTAVEYKPGGWDQCRVEFVGEVPVGLEYQNANGEIVDSFALPHAPLPASAQPETVLLHWAATPRRPGGGISPKPFNVDGYEALAKVLQRAYDQSARGKGRERHATGLPFHEQPIVRGAKDYGPGGPLFQVGKKSREAFGMLQRAERDAAVHELLGAIVYAAAAVVAIEGEGE